MVKKGTADMKIEVKEQNATTNIQVRRVGVLEGQAIKFANDLQFTHNLDRAILRGCRIKIIGGQGQ